ncbi:hypothetical protein K438DRAFT_1824716 [Mycena galopus ATCC 62051]|nr:hypothetical protein K438DRAFT_1824716 [Mycena galopus ATCC 62051]
MEHQCPSQCYPAQGARVIHAPRTRLDFWAGAEPTEGRNGHQLRPLFSANSLTYRQMHNGRLVSLATDALPLLARQHLQSYIAVFDTLFYKKGNDYRVRNPAAWPLLQAEEQSWHDWIVEYFGRPHPAWALEPLPGLQRVHVAAPARIAGPPPILHITAPVPRVAFPVPHVAVPELATPRRGHAPHLALLTPPPSCPISVPGSSRQRPIHISDDEAPPPSSKRKFLGTLDISDDEEDEDKDERPMKKLRFLGLVDLASLTYITTFPGRR